MNDIFTRIRAHYLQFTKAEKAVADFVLQNPQRVVYYSIGELSEACGVGDTSVFRFCRDLSLKGYQDFKLQLAQALAATSQEAAAAQLTGAVGYEDSLGDVLRKVLCSSVDALNETYNLTRAEDVSQAVTWMRAAQRIYCFGVGGSMVTALEAKSRLMRITPKVQADADLHLQLMSASLMSPRDVALLFSYSGATKDTLDVLQLAREAGAKCIAITRFPRSLLGKRSDLVLPCGANEGPLQGGSIAVRMSQLYLLDVLYLEYFRQTLPDSARNKERTASAITDKIL